MLARVLVALFSCGALLCRAQQAGGTADLKALYEAHRWFELRDAVAGGSAPALYRGAVAAAFNQVREAESALRPLVEDGSDSETLEAGQWLSYLYLRAGQYQKSAALVDADSAMGKMIAALPDQSVSKFETSTVSSRIYQHRLFVPASIGSGQVEFFVDSDANFSFLSESEARHLGLTVRESKATAAGVTGQETGFRVAVAGELRIGNVQLRNVAFLVLADSEEVFRNLQLSQQGAIGIPVLLALRTVRFDRQGNFEVGARLQNAKNAGAPLGFDAADPIVRTEFGGQGVPAILDTGAAVTEIWPPFARQFPDIVNSRQTSSETENGFGGKSQVAQVVVPDIKMWVGGLDLHLRPAHVLLAQTVPDSQWYYARLGLDALHLAQQVTIDFDSLTLTLQHADVQAAFAARIRFSGVRRDKTICSYK